MQMLFFFPLLAAAFAVDYCKDVCKDHTMCKYNEPNYPERMLSEENKQAIVDIHNKYRSKVALGEETIGPQPSAANMRKLKWDDELAKIAQRWVDQRTSGHDSCRDVERFRVGQNILLNITYGDNENDEQDWEAVVDIWYSEVTFVKPSLINSFAAGQWTDYTQLVWGLTEYIGCGFTAYEGDNGSFTKRYVCNYGPGGNIVGKRVYRTGVPCSRCKKGCENGLCL